MGNATKHGLSDHKLYKVWCTMRSRCQNPNNKRYKDYGGRGIRLCKRWQKFVNFYCDMIFTYQEGLTLERINTNGNYTPSNCKWDTRINQARNTRSNHVISYKGIRGPISKVCERIGVEPKIVYRRIRDGWSVIDAISTPRIISKINYSKRK